MPQKVSLIKWSNSFPGIISIVYAEHPAMVFLYDTTNLSQPGKFYETDPDREHGSVQYFTDSVVCMDWGYNKYDDYLALGLANGDVIVRPCNNGFFKESIYSKMHDSQSQSCICLKWRKTNNHIAVGTMKDDKNYCIDVLNIDNKTQVIPTIVNSRVLLSLQWVDRKSPDTLSSSPKQHSKNNNYMGLREKVSDSQDFLIAGFENIIQVYSIQSSYSQVIYSISRGYKHLVTINSQIAIVNSNMLLSTAPSSIDHTTEESTDFHIHPSKITPNHIHIEHEDTPSIRIPRAMSFDYREGSFSTKKKEVDVVSPSSPTATPFNVVVYDVDSTGSFEKVVSFTQQYSQLLSVSWYSNQELFLANPHGFSIVNIHTGAIKSFDFPKSNKQILQCCIDNLVHPIITRIIVYLTSDKSVYWDYIIPVVYHSISFVNNNELCIVNKPDKLEWAKIENNHDEDIFTSMIQRCQEEYGENIEKNIRLFEKLFNKDPKDDNYIDLYFFWMVFQIIRQLDDEDSSAMSSHSPLASDYDYSDDNPTRNKQQWLHNGIVSMIIENPVKYREEKYGRIRVFKSEKRESLIKKILEVCNHYYETYNDYYFHHLLLFIIQGRFHEGLGYINKLVTTLTSHEQTAETCSTIERLLVLSNILMGVLSLRTDTSALENLINLQLRYFTKANFPIIFKMLQFLLMYIRYDNNSLSPITREQNERSVINYLLTTSDGRLLAVEDVIVMLRYLSNTMLREYFNKIEKRMLKEGFLLCLLVSGTDHCNTHLLLQHFINRTSDVQTVSILSLYIPEVYQCSQHWIKYYYDLLERAELFNFRCSLEYQLYQTYGEQLSDYEEHTERYVPGVIVCSSCNTKLIPQNTNTLTWRNHNVTVPVCMICKKPLFTCSLCSLPVRQDTADWLVWCYSCHHGGHYSHITKWFESHSECPVNGCTCHCNEI